MTTFKSEDKMIELTHNTEDSSIEIKINSKTGCNNLFEPQEIILDYYEWEKLLLVIEDAVSFFTENNNQKEPNRCDINQVYEHRLT